jgi:murein L,D-transpeptidase YafK
MLNRRSMLGLSAVALVSACGGADSLSPYNLPQVRPYTGPEITEIQVFKARRELYVLHGREIVRKFDIALGGRPVGAKEFEGDYKTPEGGYRIDRRNARSSYHLSLGISYPNEKDIARAAAVGKRPGGDIFIHGRAGKDRGLGRDWTAGCIAVTDGEIEDLWAMVRDGTPIYIFP